MKPNLKAITLLAVMIVNNAKFLREVPQASNCIFHSILLTLIYIHCTVLLNMVVLQKNIMHCIIIIGHEHILTLHSNLNPNRFQARKSSKGLPSKVKIFLGILPYPSYLEGYILTCFLTRLWKFIPVSCCKNSRITRNIIVIVYICLSSWKYFIY